MRIEISIKGNIKNEDKPKIEKLCNQIKNFLPKDSFVLEKHFKETGGAE